MKQLQNISLIAKNMTWIIVSNTYISKKLETFIIYDLQIKKLNLREIE